MHTKHLRHEFLRLRARGQSLASIGRQLSVSKPTLIKWNRELQPQLAAAVDEQQRSVLSAVAATSETDFDALHRRIAALKQELFSRSISDLPTPVLETLLGSLQEKLRSIEDIGSRLPVERLTTFHVGQGEELVSRVSASPLPVGEGQGEGSNRAQSNPIEP